MGKIYKSGRCAVVLQGRYAGKKCLVAKSFDDGSKARPFAHCLVVGVAKAPLKVKAGMGKKKLNKRLAVKPFAKYVNQTHLMPTRYQIPAEMDPKIEDMMYYTT